MLHSESDPTINSGLRRVTARLTQTLERDALVHQITHQLRDTLQVDRVVLYYFYKQWRGQVTIEALSAEEYSIYGSTGPDECFNDEYAALYLSGRVRAIPDIDMEPIAPCHRDFLKQMQVRANLVVPILTDRGLWGLLVAHHCQDTKNWTSGEIAAMQQAASTLATSPAICTPLL